MIDAKLIETLSALGADPYSVEMRQAWADAAPAVAKRLGIELAVVVIGPGQEVTDLYFDWAKLCEVDEDGIILVRPDKHVGWRSMTMVADPELVLVRVLAQILHREV